MIALVFGILLFGLNLATARLMFLSDTWPVIIGMTVGLWCGIALLLFLWMPFASGVMKILLPN